MAKTKPIDLETSLQSLEDLINRMESGQLTLEDSLQEFEQGIKLILSLAKIFYDFQQW